MDGQAAQLSRIRPMCTEHSYQLLDFGYGRKLERFGERILDRPAPQAKDRRPQAPERWPAAHARFSANRAGAPGIWVPAHTEADTWQLVFESLRFELRCTDQGQVGVFPEQAENWNWIRRQVESCSEPPRILNLFAYTGGSTLAAAAAGAAVTHVDAAPSAVLWGRENARLSHLESASIRWISEDAPKFVRRELRRGRRYQGIILDPPSFGRGPKGEIWKLSQHLPDLLRNCCELVGDDLRFLLLTCHTTGLSPETLRKMVQRALLPEQRLRITRHEMVLRARHGGGLSSGWGIRGTIQQV
jgi:23S rRNA (cytosine1962-C5)-methyltransferase